MGYNKDQISEIIRYAKGSGSLDGCPYINPQSLKAKGFTDEMVAKIDKSLPSVFDITFAFNKFSLGTDFLIKTLGFDEDEINSFDFDVLSKLGFPKQKSHLLMIMSVEL